MRIPEYVESEPDFSVGSRARGFHHPRPLGYVGTKVRRGFLWRRGERLGALRQKRVVGFVNVLVAMKVPLRDGKALGATEFTNTQAAYEDLPAELKAKLAHATATHDWNNFHELMRRQGSKRPALTAAQRSERPVVSHPVFLTHPITGRKVIYVNAGFTMKINKLDPGASSAMLETLFAHVLKPKYRYVHHWRVGDVLMWDHIGTWHYAVPDYAPDEHRLMKRCQVLANRIFDAGFLQDALGAGAAAPAPLSDVTRRIGLPG